MSYVRKIKKGTEVRLLSDYKTPNGDCIIGNGEIGKVVKNRYIDSVIVSFGDYNVSVDDLNIEPVDMDQNVYEDIWIHDYRDECVARHYVNDFMNEDKETHVENLKDKIQRELEIEEIVEKYDEEHGFDIKISKDDLKDCLEALKKEGLLHYAPKAEFIVNYIKSYADDRKDPDDEGWADL